MRLVVDLDDATGVDGVVRRIENAAVEQHLAVARGGRSTIHYAPVFPGDRTAVRAATVRRALLIMIDNLARDQAVPDPVR